MHYKIGFVGEKDAVYAFGMLGMNVHYVSSGKEFREVIQQLVSENYGVIFVTEKMAKLAPDIIRKYDEEFVPAIILIPSEVESESIGLQRIQENVKKAVGQNIL